MIGKIKGILVGVEGIEAIVDTPSGVGYRVYLPQNILSNYAIGAELEVMTYLQVREDALILFGFANSQQYKLFNLLLTVPGVGPKTAFGVISVTKPDELIEAIKKQDSSFFSKVKGLGKKTALKIMLELSSKFDTEFKLEHTNLSDDDKTVIEALKSLGFRAEEASKTLEQLDITLSTEDKITAAIRKLSHRS